MSVGLVVCAIQEVLNKHGDNVVFNLGGANAGLTVLIDECSVMKANNEFSIPLLFRSSGRDTATHYVVNAIRIPQSMLDDYNGGHKWSEDEIIGVITSEQMPRFGYANV